MRDLMNMMKQAKDMQAKMAELQEEMEALQAVGVSGAGLVELTLSGKGDLKGLRIDPSLAKADEVDILEDLIVAAHADAKVKAEALLAEKMRALTGGLGLPAGLKLPF